MKSALRYYKKILCFLMLICSFFLIIYIAEDDRLSSRLSIDDGSEDTLGDNDRSNYTHNDDGVGAGYPPFRVRHKLVIMTYMRSGSSLTGDLLQQSNAVFYLYEPLWYTETIWLNKTGEKELRFLNGTTVAIAYTDQFLEDRSHQVLDAVLNCNLMDLDVGTLTQSHMASSLSTRMYRACASNQTDMTELKRCVRVIQNDCRRSEVIVLKVIRSTMMDMYHLMTMDPKVKVLHLLRDPRGTLKSQYLVGRFSWAILPQTAQRHCRRVSRDLGLSEFVSAVFPGRVFTLRYEDLVEMPVHVTEQLYRFVHLNLTGEIRGYIWSITYSGNPDNCNICTVRKNATETANSWRKQLSFKSVLNIQAKCFSLMTFLGYRLFNSDEDLRNEHITSTN